MHQILIAADKFKTTLSSQQVADALARGIGARLPEAEIESYVVSDGGEGFLDAVAQSVPLQRRALQVRGPFGRRVDAELGVSGDGATIYIESCQANGFHLIDAPGDRHPLRTSSAGVGDLLRAALKLKPEAVYLSLGSSATVDAGLPALAALGFTFHDTVGRALAIDARGLSNVREVRWPPQPALPEGTRIYAIVDVDNPPVGPEGGVRTYGPQKGADPSTLEQLEAGIVNLLTVIERQTGRDLSDLPGGGAAGCLGLGLAAFVDAELVPGAAFVIDSLGLAERMARCSALITGEGSFDRQSLHGKIPGSLLQLGAALGKPVFLVTGRRRVPEDARALSAACLSVEQLIDEGLIAGIGESAEALRILGERIAEQLERNST